MKINHLLVLCSLLVGHVGLFGMGSVASRFASRGAQALQRTAARRLTTSSGSAATRGATQETQLFLPKQNPSEPVKLLPVPKQPGRSDIFQAFKSKGATPKQTGLTITTPGRTSKELLKTDLRVKPKRGYSSQGAYHSRNFFIGSRAALRNFAQRLWSWRLGLGVLGATGAGMTILHASEFNVQELYENIKAFKVNFPTKNNRIENLRARLIEAGEMTGEEFDTSILEKAKNVRPIVAEKTIALMNDFLENKRKYGSAIEKELYKNMTTDEFMDRLISKRPLMFMNRNDQYLLRDGTKGRGGFEDIGTEKERGKLKLEDYLSYDEMEISALIAVSVPTFFINNGARDNEARIGRSGTYEKEGIFTGVVGARFEKKEQMESKYMLITPEKNTEANGYGKNGTSNNLGMWAKFYGVGHFPTFEEVKDDKTNYIKISRDLYLNKKVYKERMRLVIEPYLVDANERGKEAGKKVYCHAVGLGLGAWGIAPKDQQQLMLEVYEEVMRERDLENISDINFSHFNNEDKKYGGLRHGETFRAKDNNITIQFSKRNPADKLKGSDEGKLLVAQYAWDGNSYPGNEYWKGFLSASGDPAAACCSLIAELQNPEINPYLRASKAFQVKSNQVKSKRIVDPTTTKKQEDETGIAGGIAGTGLTVSRAEESKEFDRRKESNTESKPSKKLQSAHFGTGLVYTYDKKSDYTVVQDMKGTEIACILPNGIAVMRRFTADALTGRCLSDEELIDRVLWTVYAGGSKDYGYITPRGRSVLSEMSVKREREKEKQRSQDFR